MTFTYPAVFTEKEDGTGYHAFFPDLEMCEADGADLEDAIENARDAAQNWICLLYTSPSPRDLSTSRMPSSA